MNALILILSLLVGVSSNQHLADGEHQPSAPVSARARAFDLVPQNLRVPAACLTLLEEGALTQIATYRWGLKIEEQRLLDVRSGQDPQQWGERWIRALIREAYAWQGDADSWIQDEIAYCMNPPK